MGETISRFAGFSYSARAGLSRGGKPIRLVPQARQLLELLIEYNGKMVSRAEIAARLWPHRPASDDSIDRCAYLLRKPLREAGGGDLIATFYGRGIALRAQIETAPAANEDSAPLGGQIRILDLWQPAYELSGSRTRAGFARAQEAVQSAVESNPSDAAAWSLSADIAVGRVVRGFLRPNEAAALIECAAAQALSLAPGFLPARASLGWARGILENDLTQGLALLDEVVADDPNFVRARAYRPWLLVASDRLDAALIDAECGAKLSPLDINCLSMHAWLTLCAGDAPRADEYIRKYLALRPDSGALWTLRAAIQLGKGENEEAVATSRRAVANSPDDPFLLTALAYSLAQAKQRAEAESIVDALAAGTSIYAPPCALAAPVLALGRKEEALDLLRRAREDGCPWFAFTKFDFRFLPLRAEIEQLRATAPHEYVQPKGAGATLKSARI